MGKDSKISWTHHTFNPWWGCEEVSPGCNGCYARELAARYGFDVWGHDKPRLIRNAKHFLDLDKWNRAAIAMQENHRVFSGSMCDILEDRDDLDEPRQLLWDAVERTHNLIYLLLSKRPLRRRWPRAWIDSPRHNVLPMVSVETQTYMWRVWQMLDEIPSDTAYGISAEPLLGPLVLPRPFLELGERGWCIVGGESGAAARPMDPKWARSLRDQCIEAEVPFFYKQDGAFVNMVKAGSGHNGDFLDGIQWHQIPPTAGAIR